MAAIIDRKRSQLRIYGRKLFEELLHAIVHDSATAAPLHQKRENSARVDRFELEGSSMVPRA